MYFALSELERHSHVPRGDAPRFARRLPLANIFRAFGAAVNPLHYPLAIGTHPVLGITFTPFVNYGARNLVAEKVVSQENIGAVMLANQVHELGNSLAIISGWGRRAHTAGAQSPTSAGDTDAGTLFEKCVFGGHVIQEGMLEK